MEKLTICELDYKLALKYFKTSLKDANALSEEIINNTNLSKGNFFVFSTLDANIENIYKFESGGFLLQNSIIEYGEGSKKSKHQLIPNIRIEVSRQIRKMIEGKDTLYGIIDDVTLSSVDYLNVELFQKFGVSYNNEAYFAFNRDITDETIQDMLRKSNAFWHSLCVLTLAETSTSNHVLTRKQIEQIARDAQMILVGAYDGEGYIFWKKT